MLLKLPCCSEIDLEINHFVLCLIETGCSGLDIVKHVLLATFADVVKAKVSPAIIV